MAMAIYLWLVVMLIIILCVRKNRQTASVVRQIQNRRKQNKEKSVMKELDDGDLLDIKQVSRMR